jgi:hypothetical protein
VVTPRDIADINMPSRDKQINIFSCNNLENYLPTASEEDLNSF